MRYSLLAGGKRLRPILALAACEAVGGALEAAMGFACAIEMIHTYSLIHDDLPCMDDDDLRRGRPTNHKVYGEAIATLAGDGLLTDAFKVLAIRRSRSAGVPPPRCSRRSLNWPRPPARPAWSAGQAIDLLGEGRTLTIEELEYLHRRKDRCAVCRRGPRRRAAGWRHRRRSSRRCSEYARALGLAFQVIDDLLDVEASTEQMGKRTHKDEAHGKATYPALIGVNESRAACA